MKKPSVGHFTVDPPRPDAEFDAAIGGDVSARWRALEACRDYLQLVVRRGQWSNRTADSATSDLVQDTIVGGWRSFSRFQGRTPAQLRAWLRVILVHASLKARRLAIEARVDTENLAGPITSPSHAADQKESQIVLDAALAALPPRSRTAIHMRLWEGRSFADIGTQLGISEDAARMLYGRALAKLRESLRRGHAPG